MRIITLNVNGLRSAAAKGFGPWMRRQGADVVCLLPRIFERHAFVDVFRTLGPRPIRGYLRAQALLGPRAAHDRLRVQAVSAPRC